MRRIPCVLSVGMVLALAMQAPAQGLFHRGPRNAAPDCCPPAPEFPLTPQVPPQPPGQLPPPGPQPQPQPGQKPQPGPQPQPGQQPDTGPQAQADTTPPSTDAFAQAPPAGGAEAVGFNPAMFGDIVGGPNVRTVVRLPNGATVAASVPVIARSAFKIADNESPRPTDRIFLTYNYFDRVNTSTPSSPNPTFNLHREMIGFEKTFFEGSGSFGLRLPFLQLDNAFGGLDNSQIGDLSFIFKWAFINDLVTGNVFSAGMVVTAPTGDPFLTVDGRRIRSTLLQPYLGYIYNRGNFFLQGFSSVVATTDSTDVTLLLNDIGVGYWLIRDPYGSHFIRGVVPTFEIHVTTPLNHRGNLDDGGVPDWVTLTTGVNLVFGQASTLGFAIGAPVTGPRPYNLEAMGSVNFRF
jgi:hypothetical protein